MFSSGILLPFGVEFSLLLLGYAHYFRWRSWTGLFRYLLHFIRHFVAVRPLSLSRGLCLPSLLIWPSLCTGGLIAPTAYIISG